MITEISSIIYYVKITYRSVYVYLRSKEK